MTTYPADRDGAGAWLLPAYYSYRTCGEVLFPPVLDLADEDRRRHTVNGLKTEMRRRGFLEVEPKMNGVFGASMRDAVRRFQQSEGLTVDGTVGPITARRIAKPLVQLYQLAYGIPNNLLAGLMRLESGWDPGAEGVVRLKSTDRGWAQISDVSFPHLSDAFCYADLPGVVEFAAQQLTDSGRPVPGGPTYAELNRWDCAILHHNTPVGAKYLFENGQVSTPRHGEYIWLVAMNANKPW
jgi:hypothetical protein